MNEPLKLDLPPGISQAGLTAIPMEQIENMIKVGGEETTFARMHGDYRRMQYLEEILNRWKQVHAWRKAKEQYEKKLADPASRKATQDKLNTSKPKAK